MKKLKWKESRRTVIGLQASGHCQGPGWSNPGYYSAVYEVMEWCGSEGRLRYEVGLPCRDYGEGYDAFVSLYEIYLKKAAGGGK